MPTEHLEAVPVPCNCTSKCASERVRGPEPFEICIDYCTHLVEADMKYQQQLQSGQYDPRALYDFHQKIRINLE